MSEGHGGGGWKLTLRLAKRGPLEPAVALGLELLERLHAPRDQHETHHAVRVLTQLIHLMHLEKRRARDGPGFWRRGTRSEFGERLHCVCTSSTALAARDQPRKYASGESSRFQLMMSERGFVLLPSARPYAVIAAAQSSSAQHPT